MKLPVLFVMSFVFVGCGVEAVPEDDAPEMGQARAADTAAVGPQGTNTGRHRVEILISGAAYLAVNDADRNQDGTLTVLEIEETLYDEGCFPGECAILSFAAHEIGPSGDLSTAHLRELIATYEDLWFGADADQDGFVDHDELEDLSDLRLFRLFTVLGYASMTHDSYARARHLAHEVDRVIRLFTDDAVLNARHNDINFFDQTEVLVLAAPEARLWTDALSVRHSRSFAVEVVKELRRRNALSPQQARLTARADAVLSEFLTPAQ